jgi:glycosyltransferase involved in cell wall biosynthesis
MLAASPDREKKGGVSNLTRWLSTQSGVEVTLLCFGPDDAIDEVNGCRVITLRKRKIHKLLPFVPLLRIRNAVRREHPDVLHVQGSVLSYPLLYAILLSPKRMPKVITVHGHPIEEGLVAGWLREHSFRLRLMAWAEKKIPSRFDAIVTVTARLRNDLRARYDTYAGADIWVIPNGVDAEEFSVREIGPDFALGDIRRRKDCLTILNAKALTAFNGQEFLIRAFEKVVLQVPDSRLLLFGTGPDLEKLTKLSGDLGISEKVHFLGHVLNKLMPSVLSMTDIVVLPSVRVGGVEEGSSLGLIEAMACSRAVVASDVGGSGESIVSGENGLLVPERNPEAIAEAILRIHGDKSLAARLGRGARDYVMGERTWERISARYTTAYEAAISKSRETR